MFVAFFPLFPEILFFPKKMLYFPSAERQALPKEAQKCGKLFLLYDRSLRHLPLPLKSEARENQTPLPSPKWRSDEEEEGGLGESGLLRATVYEDSYPNPNPTPHCHPKTQRGGGGFRAGWNSTIFKKLEAGKSYVVVLS